VSHSGANPSGTHQDSTTGDNNARTKSIDQIASERKQHCLSDYKKSESPLDRVQAGVQTPGQVSCE